FRTSVLQSSTVLTDARCLRNLPTRQGRSASKQIRPEAMTMNGVQQASRQDLARALAPRYAHASRLEKGQILDEFCAITGLTRKHTLVLLGNPPAEHPVSNRRGRPPSYGPAEVALLRVCWAALDGVCSKRLAPFLPE